MENLFNRQYPKIHDILKAQYPAREIGEGLDMVDIDDLLKIKQELQVRMEGRGLCHYKAIESALQSLTTNEIAQLYSTTIDRIKKETNYFHETEELKKIIEDEVKSKRLKIILGSEDMWKPDRYAEARLGIESEIHTRYSMSSQSEILRTLAIYGDLPEDVRTLIHECVHVLQIPDISSLIKTYPGFIWVIYWMLKKKDWELTEAQAVMAEEDVTYHDMDHSKYSTETQRGPKSRIVDRLADLSKIGLGRSKRITIDKLIYSLEVVEQLSALGLSYKQVAGIIKHPGKWDKKEAIYPKIQKEIDQRLCELNLDKEDLENLISVERIEREIQQLRVRDIVQEELRKIRDSKKI